MPEIMPAGGDAAPIVYSRNRPFWAEIIRHYPLTNPGSQKDTRHMVLNLEGSGLTYLPGDSLGAFGANSPALVREILDLLGFDPEYPLRTAEGDFTVLREALSRDYILNRANRKIVGALAQRLGNGPHAHRLRTLLDQTDALREYLETRDYVDLLREFPAARFPTPESFIAELTPVTPRLYSIASSPLAHPGEAHLCVAVVRYDAHGRPKKGLASGFLADHADMFLQSVPVYIQPSRTFRLPPDGATDIIMVGPGTGIAPFRAFVEHRIAQGATGRNWLFFGEQRRATDFLYEAEWERYLAEGKLHRLDVAFSRDQAQKVYVQHRMREHARDLWEWLQSGAWFYVCGDAHRMAKDVHQCLIDIAREQGGLAPDAAEHYVSVELMKNQKRYLRDVY